MIMNNIILLNVVAANNGSGQHTVHVAANNGSGQHTVHEHSMLELDRGRTIKPTWVRGCARVHPWIDDAATLVRVNSVCNALHCMALMMHE
jgi:hypothetical protein